MRIHYEQKDGRHSQDIDCLSSLCLSQGKPQLWISQSFCLLNIYTQAAMHAQEKSHTFRQMGIWQIHGPQNSLENGPQNTLENSPYVSSQFYIQFLTLASLLNWWPHQTLSQPSSQEKSYLLVTGRNRDHLVVLPQSCWHLHHLQMYQHLFSSSLAPPPSVAEVLV